MNYQSKIFQFSDDWSYHILKDEFPQRCDFSVCILDLGQKVEKGSETCFVQISGPFYFLN